LKVFEDLLFIMNIGLIFTFWRSLLSVSGVQGLPWLRLWEIATKDLRNDMCPGWVKTDMGGPNAPRDVGQAADTAVWLALGENIPTGRFFRDRTEIEW